MAGLVPATHALAAARKAWVLRPSPRMTGELAAPRLILAPMPASPPPPRPRAVQAEPVRRVTVPPARRIPGQTPQDPVFAASADGETLGIQFTEPGPCRDEPPCAVAFQFRRPSSSLVLPLCPHRSRIQATWHPPHAIVSITPPSTRNAAPVVAEDSGEAT